MAKTLNQLSLKLPQKVRSTWQQVLKNPKCSQILELLRDFSQFYFAETEITGILDELGIEYVHAPYYNAAQMKWFVDYSYAHLACGLEGFIFNFNHMIVDFDFKNEEFYRLEVKKLQKSMGLDQNKMANCWKTNLNRLKRNLNTLLRMQRLNL